MDPMTPLTVASQCSSWSLGLNPVSQTWRWKPIAVCTLAPPTPSCLPWTTPPSPHTLSPTKMALHSTHSLKCPVSWDTVSFFPLSPSSSPCLIEIGILLAWEKDKAGRKAESPFLNFLLLFPKSTPQRGDNSWVQMKCFEETYRKICLIPVRIPWAEGSSGWSREVGDLREKRDPGC